MSNIKELKTEITKIHIGTKNAFSRIKEELDEHLDSINQNTNEIQVLYGYLSEIENKVEKLNERLDEITFSNKEYAIQESFNLTVREEEVFIALYMSEGIKSSIQISKILGLTEDLVNAIIFRLISKGIPVLKETINNVANYSLDKNFKDLQARKNIVNVNQNVLEQFAELRF